MLLTYEKMNKLGLLGVVLPHPVMVQVTPSKVPSAGLANEMKSRLSFVAIE